MLKQVIASQLQDDITAYKGEVDRVQQALVHLHQAVQAGNLSAQQAALDEEALHVELEKGSCWQLVLSHLKRTTSSPHCAQLFRRTYVAVFFNLP